MNNQLRAGWQNAGEVVAKSVHAPVLTRARRADDTIGALEHLPCSITGGRKDQPQYAAIVRRLQMLGHTVPTAGLSDEGILGEEASIAPRAVYERDTRWVQECDALVAEVSTPSHGVGYEIALALTLGAGAVLLRMARVSKMRPAIPTRHEPVCL